MDKPAQDNRANQLNPNYEGHKAGYQGNTEKSAMDNKSNQQNPNNPVFMGGQKTDEKNVNAKK